MARASHDDTRRMRSTTAFIIEALALLLVLIVSMAVFTQLFARSTAAADQSARICKAVNVAEDVAEEFSADPAAVAAGKTVGAGVAKDGRDGFDVSCDVNQDATGAGTLWKAHIKVSDDEGTAFELDTSRYVSEAR